MKTKIKNEIKCIFSTKAQNENCKKILYLDMVKGLAIILVVLGHIGTVSASVNIWLSTFHLPAFFMVSGMLMNLNGTIEMPFKSLLKKRTKQILIPYMCFSIAFVFYLLMTILINKSEWSELINVIYETFTFQGFSILWFLTALFIAEIIIVALMKCMSKFFSKTIFASSIVCIITTILAMIFYIAYKEYLVKVLPTEISNEIKILVKALIGSTFISYGYILWNAISNIDKLKKCHKIKYRILELILGIALFVVNIFVLPYIHIKDLNSLNIGMLPQYLVLGISGSFGLILIFRNIPNVPILSYFGKNSLIVMCTHTVIAPILTSYINVFFNNPNLVTYIALLATMLLEIPIIVVINVFFPFMIGKKYKN